MWCMKASVPLLRSLTVALAETLPSRTNPDPLEARFWWVEDGLAEAGGKEQRSSTHGELRIAAEGHGDARENGRLSRTVHTDNKVDLGTKVDSSELVGLRERRVKGSGSALSTRTKREGASTDHEVLEVNLLNDAALCDTL